MSKEYEEFLQQKKVRIVQSGFAVEDDALNKHLFDFQRFIVKKALKDATMSRVGIPDYVLVFRKDGERDNPVHVDIPVDLWQKWASPVWMDIDYGNTLNRNEAREEADEKHICPLQLPTIERLIGLYTNPGDVVLTPFGGIFSEIYQAVKMGRRGLAFELKKQYFDVGCKNMAAVEMQQKQLDIFSMSN